jgi:hypothetical protein
VKKYVNKGTLSEDMLDSDFAKDLLEVFWLLQLQINHLRPWRDFDRVTSLQSWTMSI